METVCDPWFCHLGWLGCFPALEIPMKFYVWVRLNRQSTWNLCETAFRHLIQDLEFLSFNKEITHTYIYRKGINKKYSFHLSIYSFLPYFLYTTLLIAMEESTRATNYLPYSKLDCENKNSSLPLPHSSTNIFNKAIHNPFQTCCILI